MKWCEDNHVDYLFGLARNASVQRAAGAAMQRARAQYASTGRRRTRPCAGEPDRKRDRRRRQGRSSPRWGLYT
ncbi:MAG: hypothetical protein ACLFPO_06845 [Spirochaetaceae bacterium]